MTINSIDRLILTLILVHPYTVANLQAVPELRYFLMEEKIRERYPYMCLLLDDRIDPGELSPLHSYETAVFLENYIRINEEINSY